MQLYLKQVMDVMLHKQSVVRMSALQVIIFTLKQGLVHPVQCVPYLVTMGSDEESAIKVKADQMLSEIDSRYPGFIQMKAIAGIKMSYHLQKLLQTEEGEPIRGVREKESGAVAVCNHVYSIIRSSRQHRRALLTCLLNLFDEQAVSFYVQRQHFCKMWHLKIYLEYTEVSKRCKVWNLVRDWISCGTNPK